MHAGRGAQLIERNPGRAVLPEQRLRLVDHRVLVEAARPAAAPRLFLFAQVSNSLTSLFATI